MYAKYHKEQKTFFDTHTTFSYTYRLKALQNLQKELLQQKEFILHALYNDFKKSPFEGFITEYAIIMIELKESIKNLKRWMKPQKIAFSLPSFPSKEYIYKEPFGQVLIISPWNYPFSLALAPLIAAVCAGNCVTLKASELSVNVDALLATIIKKVFHPLHVTSFRGDAKVAQSLLALRWDYIFFTGSIPVGKIVAKQAAKNLTPVTLELGGKNPVIINKDTDIKMTAKRIIWGKFLNAGQTCIAPDYLLVHEDIYDEFVTVLQTSIKDLYGNDIKTNSDYARIINDENFERLAKMLEETTIVAGGVCDAKERFISPTLLDKPALNSQVMKGEIFGPILPLLTFKTAEDIKSVLAHYEKPLALYVFSKDKNFIKEQISTHAFGGGCVNDILMHIVNLHLPFGGVGHSGMGAYHGKHGFELFSHKKSISHRFFFLDFPFRYAPYTTIKLKLLKIILGIK